MRYEGWRAFVCAAAALVVGTLACRGLESCGARWLPLAMLIGCAAFVLAFVGAERVSRPA